MNRFTLMPALLFPRLRSCSAAPVPAADPADQTRPGAVRAAEGAVVSALVAWRVPRLPNTTDLASPFSTSFSRSLAF